MTRYVFDTAQVAHVWAQGRQESGRNSACRVFFEGAKLFSYGTHFLTGYRLPDGAAFLNSARYSVSTSRHCQDARHAIPGRLSDVTGQPMRLYIPGPLMGTGGGRRGYSSGFPLPDFFDSRVFAVRFFPMPDGTESATGIDAEGTRQAWTAKTRPATPAELKEARPALLKLFLDCEETAPAESIVAAFRYAGAKPEEAAKAAQKVAAAHAKRAKEEAAKAAKAKADQAAAWARRAAALPLSDFAAQVEKARRELATRNWRGAWENLAEGLLGQAKELFKARKEAKARGWTRLAADLLTREKLLRAGAARLEADSFRSARLNYWGGNRRAIRAGIQAIRAGGLQDVRVWHEARQAASELAGSAFAALAGKEGYSWLACRAKAARADLARMAEGLEALEKSFEERQEAAKAEERAAALEKAAASLAAWRDDSGPMPGGRLSDLKGGALIRAARVTRDDSGAITGGRLETSWGAQVPLVEAVKAFRFLKLCRDKGQAWRANGHILEVGHFRVDSVSPEGDFVAGCHKINWGEVSALASRLGLSDLAPADTTQERIHA